MNKLGLFWIIILVLTACSSETKQSRLIARPVKAVIVHSLPASTEYSYAGVVTARQEIPMSFQVTGKLTSRLVDVGDEVKSGQLLATLDSNDLNIQLQIKEEKLNAAKSNMELAQEELQRYTPLLEKGYVTPSQLHQFKAKKESALADLNQASQDLAVAKRQLSYTNLYSQIDGVIIETFASKGEVVEAGKPVVKIATSNEKEISISVPENRILQWKDPDSIIEVFLWAAPKKLYKVHVREISSDTDPVTRTFIIKLSVDDADSNILLGMTASVKLRLIGKSSQISIPIKSIFYTRKSPKVWVIDPHTLTVNQVAVTLGEYGENNTVIIEKGLSDGQMIVTAGTYNLVPGQKVSILGAEE